MEVYGHIPKYFWLGASLDPQCTQAMAILGLCSQWGSGIWAFKTTLRQFSADT